MKALNVDEVVGQLLASEGFRSVEELAFVEPAEVAAIEGFDQDTAAEIQARAHDYLARIEAEQDAAAGARGLGRAEARSPASRRRCSSSSAKTRSRPSRISPAARRTISSAGAERKDGETIKHAGILDGFEISREEAEALIMTARVKAGWIEAPVADRTEGEA